MGAAEWHDALDKTLERIREIDVLDVSGLPDEAWLPEYNALWHHYDDLITEMPHEVQIEYGIAISLSNWLGV